MKYYRDLIIPPPPAFPPNAYIPPSVSPEAVSTSVTSSYFIHKLSQTWDLWAPFEQSLLYISSPTMKRANYNTALGLSIVRQNILALVYGITAVMPWLRYPDSPSSDARTYAGQILSQMTRLLKQWKLVDEIFDKPGGATRAVERVLDKDVTAKQMRKEFGEFWGVWVLTGLMMEWNRFCHGRISAMDLLWEASMDRWKAVSEGVDRIFWDGIKPCNRGKVKDGLMLGIKPEREGNPKTEDLKAENTTAEVNAKTGEDTKIAEDTKIEEEDLKAEDTTMEEDTQTEEDTKQEEDTMTEEDTKPEEDTITEEDTKPEEVTITKKDTITEEDTKPVEKV